MTSILNFESNVYSEELYSVTEQEFDEVMQAIAEESQGFQGYGEWSQEIEIEAWKGSKEVSGLLIKKACEHSTCPHTRCAKAVRIGGIEI
jgi:hypothetical protein